MKKLLTFFLTFMLLVVSAVSMVGCSTDNIDGGDNIPSNSVGNVLNSNVMSISLFSSPVTQSENYVAKMLTATVLPEDAPDKSVDWSIEWNENNEGEDAVLSDYISLTPLEDGSNVATVTCYKGFAGSTFMIWVKTRVGGFAKNCIVRYVGTPNSLEIFQNGGTVVYDEAWGKNIIQLSAGETYEFDLALNNALNDVSSDYVPDYSISGISIGNVNLNKKYYAMNNADRVWEFKSEAVVDTPLSFENGSWVCAYESSLFELLSVDCVDRKVSISANAVCNSINFTYQHLMTKYVFNFDSFVDVKIPYLELTVTDNNSNVSKTICVRTISTVQGVSLDANEITF